MHQKKIVVLGFLALGLLSVSISIGLMGCSSKKEDNAKYPPETELDQDEDPYPDEYLQDNNGPAQNNSKPPKKSKTLHPADLKTKLEQMLPGVKIESITKGPLPYLYQVKTEGDVFFTTTDGQLMIVGDVVNLEGVRVNYTEQARMKDRAELLKTLKANNTINFDPKDPKYTITVFTDTDCGYCRQLHKHVQEINALGIGVHYAAFPRAGTDSKTFETMQTIWCADNQNQAFNAVIDGQTLAKKSCSIQDLKQHYQLGQKLGIRGTPSVLLQDGTMIPGYMPPDALKAMLDKHFEKTS